MRVLVIVARVLGVIYLPILLGSWLWFFGAGGVFSNVLALNSVVALALGALTSEDTLSSYTIKAACILSCFVASLEYIVAAARSAQAEIGPDYIAAIKQVLLVSVYLLLIYRAWSSKPHSESDRGRDAGSGRRRGA